MRPSGPRVDPWQEGFRARPDRRRDGAQRGCGTIRMYGFGDFHAPNVSFASSSETEPAMITSSPCCQLTGGGDLVLGRQLQRVAMTKTLRTVWLSAGVRSPGSPVVAAGSIP